MVLLLQVSWIVNLKQTRKQIICLFTFRKDPLQLNSCSHDQSRFPAKIEFGVFKRRTSEIRNGDDNRCDPKHRNRGRTFSRLFLWKHRCLQSLLSLVLWTKRNLHWTFEERKKHHLKTTYLGDQRKLSFQWIKATIKIKKENRNELVFPV